MLYIEHKLLSLTYKVLTTTQPNYLHNLISVQPPQSTRSSSAVTLSGPPTISLNITDRSFRYASPESSHIWNQLPDSFYQSHQSCLDSPPHPLVKLRQPIFLIIPALIIHHSITHSLRAQNLPFQQMLLTFIDFFYLLDCLHDNGTGPDLSHSSVYF